MDCFPCQMQKFWFKSSEMAFLYTISVATEVHKVSSSIFRCELPFWGTVNRGVKDSEESRIRDANAVRKLI